MSSDPLISSLVQRITHLESENSALKSRVDHLEKIITSIAIPVGTNNAGERSDRGVTGSKNNHVPISSPTMVKNPSSIAPSQYGGVNGRTSETSINMSDYPGYDDHISSLLSKNDIITNIIAIITPNNNKSVVSYIIGKYTHLKFDIIKHTDSRRFARTICLNFYETCRIPRLETISQYLDARVEDQSILIINACDRGMYTDMYNEKEESFRSRKNVLPAYVSICWDNMKLVPRFINEQSQQTLDRFLN